MTFPTQHINQLSRIIARYPHAPITNSLTSIIEQAKKNQSPAEDIHALIIQVIDKTSPEESFISRVSHWRSTHQQNAMITALLADIATFQKSQTKRATTPANQAFLETDSLKLVPYSSDMFRKELFKAHAAYSPDAYFNEQTTESNLIKNSLFALTKTYNQYLDEFLKSNDTKIRSLYRIRLVILQDWLSKEGYETFINIVLKSYSYFLAFDFIVPIDIENFLEIHDEKQHLLNWLAVIFNNFSAHETPLAMSHIMKLVTIINQKQTNESTKNIIDISNQFMDLYVTDGCINPINIDSHNRKKIIESMQRLNNLSPLTSPNYRTIRTLKDSLMETYSLISNFLLISTPLTEQFTLLTSSLSTEKNKLFLEYINEALDSIAYARISIHPNTDKEGLSTELWYGVELNKRLESRKSERTSSSMHSKKDRSSRKQSSDRGSSKISNTQTSHSTHSIFSSGSSQDGLSDQDSSIRVSNSSDTIHNAGSSSRRESQSDSHKKVGTSQSMELY